MDEVIVEIFEMSLVAEQNDLVDFLFVRKEKCQFDLVGTTLAGDVGWNGRGTKE